MKKIILILFLVGVAVGQTNQQIKSDDLLVVRNLQYEKAKRIIRMQELKSEFDKLNIEQQSLDIEIDNWIKEQARIQKIDLNKNKFDFDKLKFVEIKQNE